MGGLDALYLTDEQIAKRIGVGVEKWRDIAHVLHGKGLPQRDPLFCNRWYWPAVRDFLDRRNGRGTDSAIPLAPDGEEDWSDVEGTRAEAQEAS